MMNKKLPWMLMVPPLLFGGTSVLASSQIEEVIVTANKREESLSDIGQSVSAISGDALERQGVSDLDDLAAAVPGLNYAPSATGTAIFTLRGVGFNESSLGVYPSVSVYIDQVPLSFPVMARHAGYDLERVEVLKGPQGTLFGQNATGGAINYVAAKPTDTWTAGGDVSYGRFNKIETNAVISGPLSDTLGMRVAMNGINSDDWQESVTRPGDTNGEQSHIAGRFILNWEATDNLNLLFNANGFSDKSETQARQQIALRPANPAYVATSYPSITFSPDESRAADWTHFETDPALGVVDPNTGAVQPGTSPLVDFSPKGDRDFYQMSVRADIDITDNITLTSLTSYSDYEQKQSLDSSGSEYLITDLHRADGDIQSFNQEFRIGNNDSDTMLWVVGATYEDSQTVENQVGRYKHTAYNPSFLYINASASETIQDIKNYAFFGNVDYYLSDTITLKAGARYTDSSNAASICSFTLPGGNVDKFFNILGGLLGTVPFDPIAYNDCYSLNENNVPGEIFKKTLDEDNVSWKVGIDYKITDDTLLYANASRGYKAGSFPSLAASGYSGLQPVTQESLTSLEVGIKTQLFDNRLAINGALFHYDYKDKQIRGKISDITFTSLDALVNVPESEIFGAEMDLTYYPDIDGLTITAAVTYLDSEVTDYTGVNFLGQDNFDHSGDVLPFTPEFSGSLDVDYRFLNTVHGSAFAGFSVSYQSEMDAALSSERLDYAGGTGAIIRSGVGDCVYCVDSYTTVNARVGFESADERWSVMLWAKNIFDEYYYTQVIASYDSASRYAGMPATYGVKFSFKFE